MLKKISIIIIALIVSICNAYSQNVDKSFELKMNRGKQFIKNQTPQTITKYYHQQKARKPSIEQQTKLRGYMSLNQTCETKGQKSLELPNNRWFPGEFEEVQAILIAWEYFHVDTSFTYYSDPVNDTLGYFSDNQNVWHLGPYFSIVDTSDLTRFPIIMAQIADAIQQGGAQVWINICNAQDSFVIKKYMHNQSMPLTNYRFFVNTNNAMWCRDYGPVGFYYGEDDSLAFLDLEYYGGRPMDDLIPIKIAKQSNIPVYTTGIEYEGGNILLDGAGSLFTSEQLYAENQDTYGQMYINELGNIAYRVKTKLSKQQIDDSLTYLFNLNHLKVLPALRYDGGTGHIDLYASMWDENNFVFTQFPSELSKLQDYSISLKNVDTILSLYSYHGKKYRGCNIPLPRKDDASWYLSNSDYEEYTRTYSNSTFVNNVIIQPIFSDDEWGAHIWDSRAIDLMKRQFPGYTIIPIDIRGYENEPYAGFDGTGGAIHCITKQIPAENPVRILHGSIQGFANEYNGTFPIEAQITNKSGIASASCFWRVKGQANWTQIPLLTENDLLYKAEIIRDANLLNDTIEYYISATSNNGKTITKPFTAPKGFYWFYHGTNASPETPIDIYEILGITDNDTKNSTLSVENLFPNPANEMTQLVVSNNKKSPLHIKMVNMMGQSVYANTINVDDTTVIIRLQTASFSAGFYNIIISDNNGNRNVKKLIIQH